MKCVGCLFCEMTKIINKQYVICAIGLVLLVFKTNSYIVMVNLFSYMTPQYKEKTTNCNLPQVTGQVYHRMLY